MLQVKLILKLKFFTYNVVDSQFLACLLALAIIHELGLRDKGNWESTYIKKFQPEFNFDL